MEPRRLKGIFLAHSFQDLRKAVEANLRQMGFRYFMYHGRFPHTRAGDNDIYFDNCPESWGAYYRARNADGNGALLDLLGAQEVSPLMWRQLALRVPALFAEARKFGLVTGSTHPVHGPGGQWSSMSFITDRGGTHAEMKIRAELAHCQLIAGYVHDAVVRIVTQRLDTTIPLLAPRPARRRLNERECQVLMWAAAGKTTAGIADMLSISERTVVFHLSNARRKLGAANSRHAISKAIALGLIQVPEGDQRSGESSGEMRQPGSSGPLPKAREGTSSEEA